MLQPGGARRTGQGVEIQYHHPHTPRLGTEPQEQAQTDLTQGQLTRD